MTVYLWRRVPLANGRGTALIWAMDYSLVAQYRWHLHKGVKTNYARRSCRVDGTRHLLHQLITGLKNVDHINGDGLDCRRSNMRPASGAEQTAHRGKFKNNTSGFIGVSWNKQRGTWVGQVMKDGKRVWRVQFDDPVEAARARDAKALEHHGEFAVLNFPRSGGIERN